jgi:catecholate siderophore receptor
VTVPGEPTTTPIRNPDPYRNTRTRLPSQLLYSAEIDDVGYYIGDTVHLSDQWIVNAGIRLDDFERDQVGGPGQANNTARVQENLISWNTGIVYKPVPIASIYAAYGTSETPIGNEIDSTGGEYNGLTVFNANVGPEETRGVEVGTKWELFDRRMLATVAIFETVKDNARTNRGVNNAATPVAQGNAGEYRVRGIEVGASGNITDKWSVFGGAVFLDTEVLDSDAPEEIGRRLANTPLTQFSLFTKYQVTDQLAIGGQAIYQTEVWSGHFAQNNSFYHTTEWWRFDAMAEYDIDKHWSVELLGINLTDTLYYDSIYQDPATFAYVAPGRSGYLTVKYQY